MAEHLDTLCVHGGHAPEDGTGAMSVPIYQTSNFALPDVETAAQRFAGRDPGYVYSRLRNPTVAALERQMARLEGGEAACAFASGMAAISATLLILVQPGGTVLAARTLYGGTHAFFGGLLARAGVRVTWFDGRDPSRLEAALDDTVQAVYIETPANPTLCVVDIAAVADICLRAGVSLVVDNTFATPCLQQPLALGADLVIHSATKYIGGHGDALGGVVVATQERVARLRAEALKELGAALSPFNAWLLLRGLKTLALRMDRVSYSAARIAAALASRGDVGVAYPGLTDHPQHEVAARQMRAFGGVVALDLGSRERGARLLDALGLVKVAVSLGDCESLAEHPASMSHRTLSEDELAALGIAPGLVRLSVGLEHPDDLIADLEAALGRLEPN